MSESFVHQFLSQPDFQGYLFMQYKQGLIKAGCTSLEDISRATPENLMSFAAIPPFKGLHIISVAKQALKNKQSDIDTGTNNKYFKKKAYNTKQYLIFGKEWWFYKKIV
jgi:hypothetical protein